MATLLGEANLTGYNRACKIRGLWGRFSCPPCSIPWAELRLRVMLRVLWGVYLWAGLWGNTWVESEEWEQERALIMVETSEFCLLCPQMSLASSSFPHVITGSLEILLLRLLERISVLLVGLHGSGACGALLTFRLHRKFLSVCMGKFFFNFIY